MTNRISLLDNRLANQIAAGEVVERPASVTKELIENSIDAGATRIEVDVERGGTRLVRITDNGSGIHKNDLELALTRHATSKIHTTDDLSNIQSLGFRGEALASISSVSRLTLTSRTQDCDLAWQAIAQGRDMAVEILPASAAVGTRIEVADLFFNTPARQKFLRTEKTEFNHIEEVFKRQALANFNIAFVLKHNHKIVKRVPAVAEREQFEKRIAIICGQPFVKNAISFECQHESLRIWGWLGKPEFHRSESDIQYVFINQRPVKDKTLNHAIRQAYEGLLPSGRMPTFVIFLEIDAKQVDVNVHPTKHEVRFSEQRLVHDLLAKSVYEALLDCQSQLPVNQQESEPEQISVIAEAVPEYMIAPESTETISHSRQANFLSSSPRGSSTRPPTHSQVRQRHQQLFANNYSEKEKSEVSEARPMVIQSEAETVDTQVNSSYKVSTPDTENYSKDKVRYLLKLKDYLWLTEINRQLYALNSQLLLTNFVTHLVSGGECQSSKSLLFPQKLELSNELIEDYSNHQFLQRLGFRFQNLNNNCLLLNQIPLWMQPMALQAMIESIPEWLQLYQQNKSEQLVSMLLSDINQMSESVVRAVIEDFIEKLIDSSACRLVSVETIEKLYT